MNDFDSLSEEERAFLARADADGRVLTTAQDRRVVQELRTKGLIEQNVYHRSFYWVKNEMLR